jgi:hypothetical protein
LIGWANELLEDDLHAIHVPGIIALWASLEVAVEDTATLILVNDRKAVDDVVKAGSSVPSSWPLPLDEGKCETPLFSIRTSFAEDAQHRGGLLSHPRNAGRQRLG